MLHESRPLSRLHMETELETPAPWSNRDKHSFAWTSARKRWPVILTQAIDDLHRSVAAVPDDEVEKLQEGKALISKFANIKYELQHDRRMIPLEHDGHSDIARYNQELERLKDVTWLKCPWLFSECYLYRRMCTYIRNSKHWTAYDVFTRSKMSGFKSSKTAVLELAAQYKTIITQLQDKSQSRTEDIQKAEENLFIEMCEICLWGNKTDLSLSPSITHDQIQKLQGSKVRKEAEKNILANDIPKAFEELSQARSSNQAERRVDIVLDNSGFELFTDLILAGYLLAAKLATHIVLHPKSMPWFVSDVTPSDFGQILNTLQEPSSFFSPVSDKDTPLSETDVSNLRFLVEHWTDLHVEGQLAIRQNDFWTEGSSFWRLPTTAPDLHSDLKESELVIFKGDLNYRKLTADVMWPIDTSFKQALGPMGAGSHVKVLALRTCKADVVVGVPQAKDEELRASGTDPNAREWAWSGDWAVCQFSNGQ